MARNGSGTYSLYTPGNPVVTGTTISSTAFNNTMNDVASALTQSVSADGQTPITGNIPMASHKITGLAAGTTAGDALMYGQSSASLTSATITTLTSTTLTATNLTATTIAIAAGGSVLPGTYTPTLTNGSNVFGSATAGVCMYCRLGNNVFVAGAISITPTAANTETSIGISLPIASAIAATTDLSGGFSRRPSAVVNTETGIVFGDAANDRATVQFYALDTNGANGTFWFAYRVL